MSIATDLLQTGFTALLGTAGVSATFQPYSGTAAAVRVLMGQTTTEEGAAIGEYPFARALLSAFGQTPAAGDYLVIGGITYTLGPPKIDASGIVSMRLNKGDRAS